MKYRSELHNEVWGHWITNNFKYFINYYTCQEFQNNKYTRYNIYYYSTGKALIRFYHISG